MTDIVGSTEHAAELGDSGWRELVQQHHRLIRSALRRHGGRELDTAGDGFFATFDAPAAAVRCALEIVDEIKQLGVEVRVGVHVGEVEQIGRKVGGISVVIASRIMSAAGPSEVLVSSTVRDLVAGSRLSFDDRGVSELKGVPGEWHIYAVSRAGVEAEESIQATSARERRASALRRAAARPIWQRRPRLVVAAVVGLAIVLATTALLAWKPWQPPALAGVGENAIGVIDPGRNEVVGQIRVGSRPGGIAVSDGYAWITNTGANTVSKIALRTRAVEDSIDVGRAPTGMAVAEGSVWVANSGERTVSRINIATDRVVQTIDVGNGPTAIAAVGDSLWVANATDSTVVRIDARSGQLALDPRTGAIANPTGVAPKPVALAAAEDGLWVASEDGAAISHLDPVTGVTVAAPTQLDARPSALGLDDTSVWVAAADGIVTRIDRATDRVTGLSVVGGALTAIVASSDAVWVGDQDGSVYRLRTADPTLTPTRISTGSSIGALALVDGSLWLAAQPAASLHRGGTLRIVEPFRSDTDPLAQLSSNASLLGGDGLVGYRHVGGIAGSVLLPDLATSIPHPSNGGLTYTFQLRSDLVYSSGEPVEAADFRRAIERSFQIGVAFNSPFTFFGSISGTDECADADGQPVDRCDLSANIVTDDRANTVTFHLSEPDPDFLYKLAVPIAYPVPESVSMHELVEGPFPGTGPYVVTSTSDTEIRLSRNPFFKVWDASVRPDGFPDEIVFDTVVCPYADGDERCTSTVDANRIAMVGDGDADYTFYRFPARTSPELFASLQAQYGAQLHAASNGTYFLLLNTAAPPFNSVDARQALSFAIDRGLVADMYGGQALVTVTCQVLPPGYLGYQPYCPYTTHPDPGGRWQAPDLEKARELVNSSGTAGAHVVVGPTYRDFELRDYLGSVLESLNYDVSVDQDTDPDHLNQAFDDGAVQVYPNGWGPDFLGPSNFFSVFTCAGRGSLPPLSFCDPEFDAAFKAALALQTTDPSAAGDAWAAMDRRVVDLGLAVPIYNGGADFVSERVGNYQYSPTGWVLFDQMWVQ